jgi:flagellar protein FlgJ
MANGVDASSAAGFALDSHALDQLRTQAKSDPDKALKQAASQFEAVFVRQLLKSMREATSQNDPLSSDTTRMMQGMYDEQIAQKLAQKGLGIADMMVKQLKRAQDTAQHPSGIDALSPSAGAQGAPGAGGAANGGSSFIEQLAPHARAAAAQTGVPAKFILGQAALESGWGAREIRGADGAKTHNLFGVKASSNWKGAVAESVTTEYEDGVPRKSVERFKSYSSYAEAFADYVHTLKSNPRYAEILGGGASDAQSFAQGLQRAGYATDPRYAEKLTRVIESRHLRDVSA